MFELYSLHTLTDYFVGEYVKLIIQKTLMEFI